MSYNIAHLEILIFMIGLKVWGRYLSRYIVIILLWICRDEVMATCASKIWLLTGICNILLVMTHI